MICEINICRTHLAWPAKFIHQKLVTAFILTGGKEFRKRIKIQVCGFFVCVCVVSKFAIKLSLTKHSVALEWSMRYASASCIETKNKGRSQEQYVIFIIGCFGISDSMHLI